MLGRIIEAKAKRAVSYFHRAPQRIDGNWPMGLRLGCTVRIDPSLFILAGDAINVAQPSGDCAVSAAGSYAYGGATFHRIFVKDLAGQEFCLQLGVEADGRVAEAILYQMLDEVFPESSDDWDNWLNDENGLIGYRDFSTPDGTGYQRMWDPNGADHIEPREYEERLTDDPYVEQVMNLAHAAMLYARRVDDTTVEYALVDKIEDDDGASVQISAGIEVPVVSLSVL
jgi:hypothetical protein